MEKQPEKKRQLSLEEIWQPKAIEEEEASKKASFFRTYFACNCAWKRLQRTIQQTNDRLLSEDRVALKSITRNASLFSLSVLLGVVGGGIFLRFTPLGRHPMFSSPAPLMLILWAGSSVSQKYVKWESVKKMSALDTPVGAQVKQFLCEMDPNGILSKKGAVSTVHKAKRTVERRQTLEEEMDDFSQEALEEDEESEEGGELENYFYDPKQEGEVLTDYFYDVSGGDAAFFNLLLQPKNEEAHAGKEYVSSDGTEDENFAEMHGEDEMNFERVE